MAFLFGYTWNKFKKDISALGYRIKDSDSVQIGRLVFYKDHKVIAWSDDGNDIPLGFCAYDEMRLIVRLIQKV